MASNRQTRISVEFDAHAVELIPIMALEALPDEFEGGGGVEKAVRRRLRSRVGWWRQAGRGVRGQRINDAFRTDTAAVGRSGRFTVGARAADGMSNQSELLPA